ncbi:MAG TPA: electron transporter RnfB [Nitrospiraceae bacterium]|jgi:Na+-translocating ferredoxin:NAD+ oxidoreductase subunit B|nr:electron transporter RnfB [Nitrospiraceae bacterium]
MIEQFLHTALPAAYRLLDIFFGGLIPTAGVGGAVEAVEYVPPSTIYAALVVLAVLGVIFGIALALVALRFVVKVDPKVEQVRDVLPGANCGACGFAGCMGYAEAVVGRQEVATNLCAPGKAAVAEQIAHITGKAVVTTVPRIARVFCQGGASLSGRKFIYNGVLDCTAAVLVAGGDKACDYGCLGYGTCMRACPFDAITMSSDNLPVIDADKCTSCGKCVAACPKQVIEIGPLAKAVVISCHSRDKGVDVKKKCQVGCIACGICVRICPFEAIALENNFARIDFEKCEVCGLCVRKCPTKAIKDHIPVRQKAYINPEKCMGIDVCTKVCPVNAISGDIRSVHAVDQDKCIGCMMCVSRCPKQAIELRQAPTFSSGRKKAKEGATIGA